MNPIENLLGRLKKVKGRNGSWTACCPAHNDGSPSLAIREGEDGRVLLHCFGGCSVP
jgi:DNA primase